MLIKSAAEIMHMREGGKILGSIFRAAMSLVSPGVTGKEIDKFIESEILRVGARPAFKGYLPEGASAAYSASTCISVNDVIVHGLPSNTPFAEGDVVKIDAGLIYNKLYLDSAVTVGVGRIPVIAKRLIKATLGALEVGIERAYIGNTIGDIGFAINAHIAKRGFVVVRNLTGHGVGYELHEEPTVYNFGRKGHGMPLREGMVIAIEPMASVSSNAAISRADDSFATHDGSISAQWEHTIAITKKGPLILTES